jgi:GNAT superfamily N-acetyltransferase
VIGYFEERFEDLWPDMKELLPAHWQEVGSMPADRLNIDVDRFMALQTEGMLICFAARDEGQLVGYIVDFIQFHPHYKDAKMAITDAFYILPNYRAKCARGLFRFAEKIEKEIGVEVRVTRTKRANNAGAFLELLKYKEVEISYSKRL